MSSLWGYTGIADKLLRNAGAQIGDLIEVVNGKPIRGFLMPRTEYGGEEYVVVKLRSGYNIGVKVKPDTRIEVLERGEKKPRFVKPSQPERKATLPRVDVISTGGTIASRVDYRTGGVEPALDAEDLYSIFPELSEKADVKAKILFSEFSENLTPDHWRKMAYAVEETVEEETRGVVICHGTDTMGYTAAALSFALKDLPVPVVLVGSQRSSDRPSSDAAINLISAVATAVEAPFAEVVVAMHEETSDTRIAIHRGTKVRKCHTSARDAFKSINIPPLAYYDPLKDEIKVIGKILRRRGEGDLKVQAEFDDKVALIKYYPGMDPAIIDWLLDKGIHGIILEGTGLGHVSSRFYPSIERATDQGVFVGMTSQCIWGSVNMNVYYTGRDLQRRGVTPLGDMLPETALVKLMWILGSTRELREVKRLMLTNLSGEFAERRWIE
ncbi:Glu-tRNA(Gln) amidotransferase subunit GatD [Candidatus Bathyarchaeota archaeon]|nr:Glu-tRNA(Gln) amidotransferase subunit GatD [Candidatus Bathyarchaeota archaeon]